jgi:hypothetical protein
MIEQIVLFESFYNHLKISFITLSQRLKYFPVLLAQLFYEILL